MDQQEDIQILEAQREIERILGTIKTEIPIVLYAQPGQNDVFTDVARQAIRFFRQLTDKIILREFNLYHESAKKLNVEHSPTLVFNPDRYNIRWLGAPLGEEGRIFLEALILIGLQKSNLNQQSLQVIQRIDTPRNIKVFVSASCPYCPQQALNALKAAVEKPDLVSLEIIDIQANPELADRYSAHSVPQTYANDILIAQGAQTEELFMLSLEKMEQQTVFIPESDAEEIEADLVIVGGGPAGLTAGIYSARSGLKTVVVEKGVLGGQVATTPIVENYPGLKQIGGKTLVDIMVTHALEYVQIFPGEGVVEITPNDPIHVQTTRRKFKTKAVLMTTGATHRHLRVPGESRLSGHGVSYCSTCDGPLFKGKKVIVVGGGNSAVTETLHMHHIGVNVTLVHRRDNLKAQDFLVKNMIQNNIPILFNTEVKEIRGKHNVEEVLLYNNKTQESYSRAVNGVFIAIGYDPAVELAQKTGLELTDEGFIKHDNYRTNVPGIYTAGDVSGGYKQIVTAAGHGAEAALVIFEDLINPYWT
ncbi:MAG: FAD-dependent oxidoreductase [Deltaproteobacteria bacterium]|jgi:thioredoxin reductase (NADPH)|nr:FAD-dependent oxidoreductase [Deltaproteobacteria bacterium]